MSRRAVHPEILLYLAAALLLAWPLILNSNYIFFQDSAAYLRYPAQAFRIVFDLETEWTSMFPDATIEGNEVASDAVSPTSPDPIAERPVSAGRSIYYGAMLYTGELIGGLWVAILAQLACVALAVHMTLTSLFGAARRSFPVVLALLGVATPLAFFVSYLMPDVFAGIAILAVANLFAFDATLPPWKRGAWLALMTLALIFHTSHTAVALLLAAPAAMLAWMVWRRPPWRAAAMLLAAVGAAILAEGVFFRAVEAVYGTPPLRPPFLMARTISDGPGYAYLLAHCPEVGLRLCDFLPRLPLGTDDFLWSLNPDTGVYGIADAETRRALSGEQLTFVLGVLKFDPFGQLAASLQGFFEQLGRFSLKEFTYTDSLRDLTLETLPPNQRAAFVDSALYRGTFPLRPVDGLIHAALAAAGAYLLWSTARAAAQPGWPAPADGPFLVFAVLVVGGVVANAAVTGILSTPHDRYQARVIWLIPLLAMIVFLRRKRGYSA